MSSEENIAERRISPRLRVRTGALAFHRKIYGQIIDAGPDGLSFQFQARCRLQPDPGTGGLRPVRESVDLVSVDDDFILIDLPVAAAADYYFADPHRPTVMLCRRCIQFGDLLPKQLMELERFLRINGSSAASERRQWEKTGEIAAAGSREAAGEGGHFQACDFNRE